MISNIDAQASIAGSRFQWKSLQVRVTILMLAIFVISIWVFALYASRLLHKDLELMVSEQQFSIVSIMVANASKELELRLRSIEDIASRISPAMMRHSPTLQAFITDNSLLHNMFNGGLFITRSDGTTIADYPITAGRIGTVHGNRGNWMNEALKGKSSIGKPIIGHKTQVPLFAVTAPILGTKREVIGVLAGVVDLSKPNFLDLVTNNRYGRTGGYVLIAPQYKLIVTATDKSRIMQPTPVPGDNPLFERFVQGFEGSGVVIDSNGLEVLASAKRIPVVNWILVAKIPTTEAFTPIHSLMFYVLLAAILMTLLIGSLTWWVLKKQLAPIWTTIKRLTFLSESDQPLQSLSITRQDEIGELIGGFNRLLETKRRVDREQTIIAEIGRVVGSTLNIKDVYEQFSSITRKLIPFDALSVNLIDIPNNLFRIAYYSGNPVPSLTVGSNIPIEGSMTGYVIQKQEASIFKASNIAEMARLYPDVTQNLSIQAGFHSNMMIPLFSNNAIIGILHFRAQKDNAYSDQDLRVAEKIGMQIAGAIANSMLFEDLSRTGKSFRESEERYQSLFEQAGDGIFIIDANANILSVNNSFADMHGFTIDEILCMGLDGLDVEGSAPSADRIRQIMSGETLSFEVEHYHKDGHTFPLSVTANLVSSGKDRMIIAIHHDLTERKRAAEKLTENQARLDLALHSVNMGVWRWDIIENKRYFDDQCCDLLGINPTTFTGKAEEFFEVVHPDDRTMLNMAITQTLKENSLYQAEYRLIRPDGSIHYIAAHGRLVRDDKEQPLRINGVMWDITDYKHADEERAKLQDQLLQSQKIESIGRLAGGVAHDFNNMLGLILGHAELALEQADPTHPLHNDLKEIQKAANRSADLTRQLLAFARQQTASRKVLDLNETIADMLKMLQRLIGEDIDLKWQSEANLWSVKMDPTQIDQILANLCINARDAISDTGKITIEAGNITLNEVYCTDHEGSAPGEYVMLIVSDNGCGMDKETIEKIFEPFFTTKGVGKGTGLGLATVFGIVKQNNGFIDVYSEPGQGTAFTIYLPRYMGQIEQAEPEVKQVPAKRGEETILLVEDEPDILNLTTMLLERQGYTVLAANTPGKAIILAGEHVGEIHLLMTDVVMPEMNGRDLAKTLLDLYPHLKRLFTSGYTADVIAQHGVLDEGVHFIQKPFSIKSLAAKVREVLDEQ